MKHKVTRRVLGALGASAIVAALACSDSSTSEPLKRASNNAPGTGGDSATNGGGQPHDTANKPATTFTLSVHVGTPRVGAADTLVNDPVPGASVTVAKFGYVFTPGNGADTVMITEVPVATVTTDSNGEASFPNLKGEPGYVIRAAPPAGLNLGSARVVIPQAYSPTVRTTLILRKP